MGLFMESERVLIVQAQSLLLESIVGLLEAGENGKFDVVSTLANNLPDLVQEVGKLEPGTIVIDEATCFSTPADLIAALLNTVRIRLIVLNTETNRMDIYDKSEFVISHPSDFIEALNYEQGPTLLQRRWYVANENK